MQSLYDYEILLNDVFHRNWHILTYLEEHKNLDALEKECISNTIMDVLLKRMYQKDWFIKTYHACRVEERSKTEYYMEKEYQAQYLALMEEKNRLVDYLFMVVPFICPSPVNGEMLYELEKSKEIFPEAWEEYEQKRRKM